MRAAASQHLREHACTGRLLHFRAAIGGFGGAAQSGLSRAADGDGSPRVRTRSAIRTDALREYGKSVYCLVVRAVRDTHMPTRLGPHGEFTWRVRSCLWWYGATDGRARAKSSLKSHACVGSSHSQGPTSKSGHREYIV